jgi:hypothetical protein
MNTFVFGTIASPNLHQNLLLILHEQVSYKNTYSSAYLIQVIVTQQYNSSGSKFRQPVRNKSSVKRTYKNKTDKKLQYT